MDALHKFDTVLYVLVVQGTANEAQIRDGLYLASVALWWYVVVLAGGNNVLLLRLFLLLVVKVGFVEQETDKLALAGGW